MANLLMTESQTSQQIASAVVKLGDGPLTESAIVEHIHPLFTRMLARNQRAGDIYLANHSLGRPMDAVADEVSRALDAWYDGLDDAWGPWMAQREHFRTLIAQIAGCSRSDAVVPKTSAGQGLRAVINALPFDPKNPAPQIVATRGEFDSIDFNLKAYAHKGRADVHWVEPDDRGLYHSDDLIAAITNETDLVACSMVCFVTGQLVPDLHRVIAAARAHGALVLIDAYHAFGAMEINFDELDADFLIAGNYKYTRGGAGACFLIINPSHLSADGGVPDAGSLFSIDTGWFAKQDTFAYRRTEKPEYEAGGDAWLESTPPALVYFQAGPGLELISAIGVDRLREYTLQQQQHLCEELTKHAIEPRVLEHRGSFVLIPTNDGNSDGHNAIEKLKAIGINADARPCPKTGQWLVRLCPDLLNTNQELSVAAERIAQALKPD